MATLSAAAPTGLDAGSVDAMGALVRVNQAAGALGTALELAIQYAGEREQFGRPIGKFQAIQHMIADLAGEAAAVTQRRMPQPRPSPLPALSMRTPGSRSLPRKYGWGRPPA
jgi:acyl-CoA dehydrogenase